MSTPTSLDASSRNSVRVNPGEPAGAATRRLRLGPEDVIALVLFIVLSCVVFLQFFFRYVVNQSFAWTEELSRFLLIAVVFVASAGAVRRGSHICVQLLDNRLSPSVGRVLNAIVGLATASFYGYAAWLSVDVSSRAWRQNMSTLPLSRGWIYALVAAAFALMAVRAVEAVVRNRRRFEQK